MYWVLKWPAAARPVASTEAAAPELAIDSDKIARLLGASPGTGTSSGVAAAPAATRFKLLGIIAPGNPDTPGAVGSALISVDDGLAKPYRIGQAVADGLVLQSVKARFAYLAASMTAPVHSTLALPELSQP